MQNTDWTAGYVADIDYTFGYYTELNPLRSRLAFLNAGWVPPSLGTHCELGFGQGLSVNIHAAATPYQWHATDFNPAQAGFAQSLAQASGANAQLADEAFAEFCTRTDLPDFDSIGLHGIWSWISDANRAGIVDFVRRKLKVGGVLYISYNTQPGWAAMAPMRDLLTEHSDTIGVFGFGIVHRINGALAFADKLFATNPNYLKANPGMAERLKGLRSHNRHYLAHEYFNRDWLPMPFSKMRQWLAPAKLNFACSADYLAHVEAIQLTTDQKNLLKEIPDPHFKQTVVDFMVNQQFRKDYWVKGARKLSALEQAEALRAHKVILAVPRSEVSFKVKGALGEAILQESIYDPILDALSDHQPKTLGQLEALLIDKKIIFSQLQEAVVLFSGMGSLAAVQEEALINQAKKATDKLNTFLINKARSSTELNHLASPVTGGGVMVSRFQQLFLLALSQGKRTTPEWALSVWQILESQHQKILKDGAILQSADDNLKELNYQAQLFAQNHLPVLKALQIA